MSLELVGTSEQAETVPFDFFFLLNKLIILNRAGKTAYLNYHISANIGSINLVVFISRSWAQCRYCNSGNSEKN